MSGPLPRAPPPFVHSIYDNKLSALRAVGAGVRVRLEGCDVSRSGNIHEEFGNIDNVNVDQGASVDVTACRIHDGKGAGLAVFDPVTRCILKDNHFWGNGCGVFVGNGGDPLLLGNTFRDHKGGEEDWSGAGLFVAHDAFGCATVRPDNVFERNAGGDVVRE